MANWKYVKIGDVCTVERGGSPRPIDKFITDDPNGINWIKIGDTDDSMYITKTVQKIIPEGMKKSRYVQPGDFLLSNSMSFGRPYILKIDGCIHDGWLVLRDNNGIFDKRFLYYYLSAPSTYQKFKNMAVGGVVNNLNSEMVRGVTVPVPTMEEQLNIVVTLDKVTKLITLRKEQLAKLDQLVKSRFIELFGEWNSNPEPLKSFLKDITYGFTNPMPDAEEGPWKITAKDVVNGKVNYDTARKTTVQAFEELTAKSKPTVGDVLLTKDGTLGRCAVVEEKGMCVNQSVAVLKCNEKILPKFLAILLQMPEYQGEMLKNAGGGTIKHIYITKVVDMMVIVPDIAQQLDFLTFVEQTDKSKLAIQQSLDKLELLKKALMQEYFG